MPTTCLVRGLCTARLCAPRSYIRGSLEHILYIYRLPNISRGNIYTARYLVRYYDQSNVCVRIAASLASCITSASASLGRGGPLPVRLIGGRGARWCACGDCGARVCGGTGTLSALCVSVSTLCAPCGAWGRARVGLSVELEGREDTATERKES